MNTLMIYEYTISSFYALRHAGTEMNIESSTCCSLLAVTNERSDCEASIIYIFRVRHSANERVEARQWTVSPALADSN